MRKKVKKVVLGFVLASTIFSSTSNVLASKITVNMPYTIEERRNVEHLSSGVVHEKIQEFTTAGWRNINILRIDLKDDYTKLKALFNQDGLYYRDKVSSMVEKQDAVGGINGDYFNYSPLPHPMGTLVSEGEMISSPIERAYANPSFYLNKDNIAKIGYLDRRILVDNYDLKETLLVNTLNKVTPNFDTPTILNRKWGEKSIGTRFHKDLIEVLVVDNIVKEVRTGGEAFIIPENGYVIAGRGKMAEPLTRFEPGQEVSLDSKAISDLEDLDFAIGGGSVILRDGEIVNTNINSKGNHPRTGIGINKDSTEIILVTIDGRDSSFKGISQEMFGAMLKRLGAYNAINLDGGGSTTMAIKPLGDDKSQVVNKPSDGGERSVVNGVGVFSNAPKGELSYLKLSTEDDKFFVNTRRNISVKGFDMYHNPVQIDPSEIKYSVDGVEGTFEGNTFIPSTSGKANIHANLRDAQGELEVKVLNEIKDIYIDIDKINIEPNQKYKLPHVYGIDENGIKSRIYPQDVEFKINGDIGYIEDGFFFSSENPNGGAITIKSGLGIKNIPVSVGSKAEHRYGFENIENYQFSAWPRIIPGNINSNPEFKDGKSSVALSYDFTKSENTRAAYINLYPDGSGINIKENPTKLGLWVKGDKNGAWLRGNILDSSKKEHTIDFAKTINWEGWKYVEANLPKDISYPISLNRIYVAETDNNKKYKGEVLIDSLSAHYPNDIKDIELPKETDFKDSLNKEMDIQDGGFRFVIANEPVGIGTIVENNPIAQMKNKINRSKISIFLNGATGEFRSGLKNSMILDASKSYNLNKHYDTIFINLNSSKGGIRATNSNQWIKLKEDLKNRSETNIIITLTTPIFGNNGFKDKLEADLFHDTMVEARENGKNIFIVYGDNKTNVNLKDGIRYISLNTNKLKSKEDIYKQNIIEFVANGADISYTIKNVFDK